MFTFNLEDGGEAPSKASIQNFWNGVYLIKKEIEKITSYLLIISNQFKQRNIGRLTWNKEGITKKEIKEKYPAFQNCY